MTEDLGFKVPEKRDNQKLKVLSSEEAAINAAYVKHSEKSFRCFYRGLTIESVRGPRVFENVIAEFQRHCFEDLADSLQSLRDGNLPAHQRFWIERTKKASKDADLGVILMWLVAFPTRPFYAQAGAANKEQASIVKERITHLLHWNPWLTEYVEVVQYVVRSTKKLEDGSPMAKLDIMSSDVAGAHGGTPDLLIINELSHVTKWEFAENLMDNADGVAQGMVIVATNAGYRGTKAEVWRNNAIRNSNWVVHILDRPAPWHTKETLADAKRRNSPSRFKRLWRGIWVSGKGDAVQEESIERAFKDDLLPLSEPEPGWEYVIGLDLGITHDHCGLFVLGINSKEQKLRTAWFRAFKPLESTGEVDLIEVENQSKALYQIFRASYLFYDPFQAKLMAQRLKRMGVQCREVSFSVPSNLVKMATAFIQVLEAGRLDCYDDEEGSLRRDFAKFNIVEKSYGHRLEAVSDEHGHADIGTAMVICLPYAVDALEGIRGFRSDEDLTDLNEDELTEDEVEDMPQELKDIYESEEAPVKKKSKQAKVFEENPLSDLD